MTSRPLVSVVVPSHNREFCVCDAVHSVLAQSYSAVECVVVDDGSTDDTVRIARETFSGDPRVRVLARAHAGVSAARNHGLEHVSGTYVTFLDSDDLMPAHRIEHQLARLADGTADVVMGRQELTLVGTASLPDWLQAHPDWWNGYYHLSILLEARHVHDVGGFDETLDIGEDIDLVVRVVAAGLRLVMLDETVVTRRYFGDNATYGLADDNRALMGAARRNLARRRSAVDT
jgi:O-antigen biosynthesis protein